MRKIHKVLLIIFVTILIVVSVIIMFLNKSYWQSAHYEESANHAEYYEQSTNDYHFDGIEAPRSSAETPRLPSDPFEGIDRILRRMPLGNAAFNVPEKMNIKDTATIQLLLSPNIPIEILKKTIEDDGLKEGGHVQISEQMEARLSGYNFTITAVTPEVQVVSRNTATQWKWDITPIKQGKHNLHLTLTAIINVDGKPHLTKAIQTYDKKIEVEVNWKQKTFQLIEKNWQWLWAVILTPIVGWFWKKRRTFKLNNKLDKS